MKYLNLSLAIIILIICFSCSSDDDTPINEDVIIGEWKLSEVEQNGIGITLQECQDLETFIFNEDFSFRAETYEPVDGEQDCVMANFSEGAWGTFSNGQYFTNTSGSNFPFTAQFSSDQNEMSIIIENPDAGINESRTYLRQEIPEE